MLKSCWNVLLFTSLAYFSCWEGHTFSWFVQTLLIVGAHTLGCGFLVWMDEDVLFPFCMCVGIFLQFHMKLNMKKFCWLIGSFPRHRKETYSISMWHRPCNLFLKHSVLSLLLHTTGLFQSSSKCGPCLSADYQPFLPQQYYCSSANGSGTVYVISVHLSFPDTSSRNNLPLHPIYGGNFCLWWQIYRFLSCGCCLCTYFSICSSFSFICSQICLP